MSADPLKQTRSAGCRVLVVSMSFSPCRAVGGKRFSFLSHHLATWCEEYHVVARREHDPPPDDTSFNGHVHRVGMLPVYPPTRPGRLRLQMSRAWERCLCAFDPYAGWVIPAAIKGIRLCRRHRLNIIVVTVPSISSLAAALIIAKRTGARLVLDYRDPLTTVPRTYPWPFGRWLCAWLERASVRRASAVVLCTDVIRDVFLAAFESEAPELVEVIYSGIVGGVVDHDVPAGTGPIRMLYAGSFYGGRRLDLIAVALSEMLRDGEISPATFRFDVYSSLSPDDQALIERLGLGKLIEVHQMVSYEEIRRIMARSDLLFLPSGADHLWAVPFKFYDYLGARRPIVAVVPARSAVGRLMREIDCGEQAESGDHQGVKEALRRMLSRRQPYTFAGAERLTWEEAARRYISVLARVAGT